MILWCCLQYCNYAFGQLKQEIIRFDEGLPSDFVKQVVLNKNGFVYLATRRGLSQYDGYRFLEHPDVAANISGMVLKDEGIYYHDVSKGLCVMRDFYSAPKVLSPNNYYDSNPNNDHWDNIFVSKDGKVWASDFNNLKYIDPKSGETKIFYLYKNPEKIIMDVRFMETSDGEIWALTNKGVFVWQNNTGAFTRHPSVTLNQYHYKSALLINQHELLLSTDDARIAKYNLITDKLVNLSVLPRRVQIIGMTKALVAGRMQILLFSGQEVYDFPDSATKPTLIYMAKDQVINDVAINETTKMIWIATNKGLVKLFKPYAAINNLMLPVAEQRPNNVINDLVEAENGKLYACANGKAVWVYEKGQSWKKLLLPGNETKCISLYIHKDSVLICTSAGIFCLANDRIVKLKLNLLSSLPVKKCFIYENKQLWILPYGKPVQVYKWPSLIPESDLIGNDAAFWNDNLWNDILVNSDGNIWLAGWIPTGFGLTIYNKQKKVFLEISRLKANTDHAVFVGDYYNRLALGADNNVLASGYGGWNLLNAKGEVIKLLNTKKYEVANDRVEGIAEDENGKVWFATEEGLHVYNKNTDKVIRISQIDGLPGDDLIYGFKKLKNGSLAIGVENGISVIDVKSIVKSKLVNKLELCAIKVNGKTIYSNKLDLELQKGETELELLFSSLTYIDRRKTIYRYKFKDEQQWNYLGNKAELSLRHLAPGNYNIVVEAGDNFENWQTKNLQVNLYVPAPFYKTQWFLVLVFTLLIMVIVAVYRYLFNQHKIENEFKRKLKDMEMQALRAQMNPHFMFNTLNSINGFIVEHKTNEASEYLTTFSKLMRNILESSKHESITLEKELQTLELYLSLEAARLEHSFEYGIAVHRDVVDETMRVPPLILQPFAENAIWHGLRNREGKGLLEILVGRDKGDMLHIIIRDNGIGRTAAAALTASQVKHKSYGVDLTSSRLKLLSSESNIVIEDLYDAEGLACGTAVHLYLPVN